jgi:hypothetical protein
MQQRAQIGPTPEDVRWRPTGKELRCLRSLCGFDSRPPRQKFARLSSSGQDAASQRRDRGFESLQPYQCYERLECLEARQLQPRDRRPAGGIAQASLWGCRLVGQDAGLSNPRREFNPLHPYQFSGLKLSGAALDS